MPLRERTARLGVCQINVTVGDLDANCERITAAARRVAADGAELAVFPELTVAGYPPEDLLFRERFVEDCMRAARETAADLPLPCLVGLPWRDETDGALRNAAALLRDGEVRAVYAKCLLPNYAVFDEKRYFTPGESGLILDVGDTRFGVVVCEDAWEIDGPARDEAAAGASVVLCLSASPFHKGKHALRMETFRRLCAACGTGFVYCNLVGGQDELVFDGGSFVLDADGAILARAPAFQEAVFTIDLPPSPDGVTAATGPERPAETIRIETAPPAGAAPTPPKVGDLSGTEEIYACLVLGTRDYVRKNGFHQAVLGLSGGIDSALAACVAVDALGADNVTGVTMPSRFSSSETRTDAERLALNLGVRFLSVPIERAFETMRNELHPVFLDAPPDVTEENMQARIRAVYLMALSNRFGWLVLNTSNKSEAAVGYGTMYGDMIGAFSVLKDVFKTTVFELSRHVNRRAGREVLPQSIIDRPPSAELRADQKDSDSLPEYDRLDPVLEAYIEQDMSPAGMIEAGFDPDIVATAIRMTDRAEWKRRQSVPGVRVTAKAFGKDRRLPITNRYR